MPRVISTMKSVRRIRTFPFSYNSVAYLPLMILNSENQIAGVGSRSGRINQPQCTFPHFVIGLFLLLLLATLKTQFSLDHKRQSSNWNQKNQNSVITRS